MEVAIGITAFIAGIVVDRFFGKPLVNVSADTHVTNYQAGIDENEYSPIHDRDDE